MNVDKYEKIWMWGVAVLLALFFGSTVVAAVAGAIHPPSHIETIDPKTIFTDARFRPQGVVLDANGSVHVRLVGMTFAWLPNDMTLPAETPVTFHVTALDVVHGFQIVRTNGQAMAVPGYVSQFTTRFPAGEYLVVCNEYCGVGHHMMSAKLRVVPRAQWQLPATASGAPAASVAQGGAHGH